MMVEGIACTVTWDFGAKLAKHRDSWSHVIPQPDAQPRVRRAGDFFDFTRGIACDKSVIHVDTRTLVTI
jgi:hypothetical protein